MSPQRSLSPREQARRARLALIGLAALLAVVAVVVVMTGGDDETAEAGPAPTSVTTTTELRPTTTAPSTTASTPPPGGGQAEGPQPPPCSPAAAVAEWPRRRMLAALIMVGVDPSSTTDATIAVQTHHVGGIFVGGNPTQLLQSGALQQLRENEPQGLMVSVDEEGGRVQRIEGIHGDVPSARDMAATMTPDEVRALAVERGAQMRALGVTVDLAPVVDVSDQPDRTVIGDRSFSADPDEVVAYAGAYAEGLLESGITPVLKHFPGHGSSSGDTHLGAAETPPLDALRQSDLVPYARLLPTLGDRSGVMLGHLTVPGLTEPGLPTSLSPATVSLLREDYGFDGVIMTDDLAGMAAITDQFGPAAAAVAALKAGVDMILYADADVPALLDRIEAAVDSGELDEGSLAASVVRTLVLKGIDPCTVTL